MAQQEYDDAQQLRRDEEKLKREEQNLQRLKEELETFQQEAIRNEQMFDHLPCNRNIEQLWNMIAHDSQWSNQKKTFAICQLKHILHLTDYYYDRISERFNNNNSINNDSSNVDIEKLKFQLMNSQFQKIHWEKKAEFSQETIQLLKNHVKWQQESIKDCDKHINWQQQRISKLEISNRNLKSKINKRASKNEIDNDQ